MERQKITSYLGRIVPLLEKGRIECSRIHAKAGHQDHRYCFVLGIDATPEVMGTDGARGSYLYVDEMGNIHQQAFIQGPEAHEWLEDNIVTRDHFFDYIEKLPLDNMSNPKDVLSRLEKELQEVRGVE